MDLGHVETVAHEAHAHIAFAEVEAGDDLTHELPERAVLGRRAGFRVDDEHEVKVVLRDAACRRRRGVGE